MGRAEEVWEALLYDSLRGLVGPAPTPHEPRPRPARGLRAARGPAPSSRHYGNCATSGLLRTRHGCCRPRETCAHAHAAERAARPESGNGPSSGLWDAVLALRMRTGLGVELRMRLGSKLALPYGLARGARGSKEWTDPARRGGQSCGRGAGSTGVAWGVLCPASPDSARQLRGSGAPPVLTGTVTSSHGSALGSDVIVAPKHLMSVTSLAASS